MIDVLGPEIRRRRTTQEKIAIVQQSLRVGSRRLRLVMVCNYRYKNRQCHCLSGGYMARSANPRKLNPPLKEANFPAMS